MLGKPHGGSHSTQTRMAARLAGSAIIAGTLLAATPATAITITVNTTTDAVDTSPGNGTCRTSAGKCSLRAAVQEANALAGTDTIKVPKGTFRLTRLGKSETAGATGDLNITRSVIIQGAGFEETFIDGGVCADPAAAACTSESVTGTSDRVLSVINDGSNPIVNVSRLTIQNGGGFDVAGGGIYVQSEASLSLYRVRVFENKSRQFGGGISNAGFLSVSESIITRNTLPVGTLGGQTASGGGIFNFSGGSVDIDRSLLAGNEAARGAGIRNAGGRLEITNTTISGNLATARGGGIMNFGSATIAFSTIAFNTANRQIPVDGFTEPRVGGGIYNAAALQSDGVASTLYIGNSIIAKNTDNRFTSDVDYAPDCHSKAPGAFTSFRGNLVGVLNENCNMQDSTWGDTRFDQVGSEGAPLDPLLAPLADNGGRIRTHALQIGSPARDEGTGVTSATFFDCPEVDQRRYIRPREGDARPPAQCDVGAFEANSVPAS